MVTSEHSGDYQHPRLVHLAGPGEDGYMAMEYQDVLRQATDRLTGVRGQEGRGCGPLKTEKHVIKARFEISDGDVAVEGSSIRGLQDLAGVVEKRNFWGIWCAKACDGGDCVLLFFRHLPTRSSDCLLKAYR